MALLDFQNAEQPQPESKEEPLKPTGKKDERAAQAVVKSNQARMNKARETLNKGTRHQRPAYMNRPALGGDTNSKVIASQKSQAKEALDAGKKQPGESAKNNANKAATAGPKAAGATAGGPKAAASSPRAGGGGGRSAGGGGGGGGGRSR